MPIPVANLKPGDRVMLNCPKARSQSHREARFGGIFKSFEDARNEMLTENDALIVGPETLEFIASSGSKPWARFLMQTVVGSSRVVEYPGGGAVPGLPPFAGETRMIAVFAVEPDGSLREEFGRRIYIERRLAMGQG